MRLQGRRRCRWWGRRNSRRALLCTPPARRWPYLRARIHPLLFFVFNATFVAFIQHLVLLGLTTPAYLAWQVGGAQEGRGAVGEGSSGGAQGKGKLRPPQNWVARVALHACTCTLNLVQL